MPSWYHRCTFVIALMVFFGTGGALSLEARLPESRPSPTPTRQESPRTRPLLVIEPERFRTALTTTLPDSTKARRTALQPVLTELKQDLVSVGSLDVIIPRLRTTVLSVPSKRQHIWDEMNRSDRFLCLLSTLRPAQWQKLSMAPGLGLRDCTEDQRPLFLSLIPKPFVYRVWQKGQSVPWSQGPQQTLTDRDREDIRIRLNTGLQTLIPYYDSSHSESVPASPYSSPWRLGRPPVTGKFPSGDTFDRTPIFARSVTEPNLPKKSDLNFNEKELRHAVRIDGAKTIGDLVQRASVACGIELHADYRFAELPVVLIGGETQEVLASDLMQALSRAVGGAWRRVETECYVLAGNREGEGALREKQIQWFWSEGDRNDKLRKQWQDKIRREENFRRFIGFASDNPFAPDAALVAKITEVESLPGYPNRETAIPVKYLTHTLSAYWKQRTAQNDMAYVSPSTMPLIRTTTVRFILPDGTAIPAEYTLSDFWRGITNLSLFEKERKEQIESPQRAEVYARTPKKPKVVTPSLLTVPKLSSIFLPANTTDEAEAAVALAVRFGFRRVFLQTDKLAIVTAGIQTGLAKGVVVGVSTPLFRGSFSPEIAPTWQDYTIQGKTMNPVLMIAPGTPGERLRRDQLRALAAIPGLAGIVFQDEAYRSVGSNHFGYNPTLRSAFLREEGIDPIDTLPQDILSWYSSGISYSFRDSAPKDLLEKSDTWNRLSGQRYLSALRETRDALEIAHPGLPVWKGDDFWIATPELTPPLFNKDYVYIISLKPRYLDRFGLSYLSLQEAIRFAEAHPTFDTFTVDPGSLSIEKAASVLSRLFVEKRPSPPAHKFATPGCTDPHPPSPSPASGHRGGV